jgi:cytochrome b
MAANPARVRVWDRFVRTFHWSLVASFATAYFYTEHIGCGTTCACCCGAVSCATSVTTRPAR